LHRQRTPAPENRPFQRLEILGIEFLPRLAREPVEPNVVHRGDHEAPALDHDRRSWTFARDVVRPGVVGLEAMLAVRHL
jgi:hypothetical protein